MMSGEVKQLKPLDAETALASGEDWTREVGRWQALIRSGGLPRHVDSPQKAITIVRTGAVFGWDPMRSLRSIYIVEGNPCLASEAMLALVRERCPDAVISPLEMTAERVQIEVERPPQKPCLIEVTADQFRHLIKPTRKGQPSVWQLYTADMLWWRAISRMCKRLFSDVIAGVRSLEEMNDVAAMRVRQVGPEAMTFEDDAPPEDGEIVEAEPVDNDGQADDEDPLAEFAPLDREPEGDEVIDPTEADAP